MKRKILKDFELTEISGVDRPAQPTAKMSIMKRADFDKNELSELIKQALNDMREGAIQDDGEDKMSDIEKLTAQVAELQKSLDEAQALAKMSDDEKMHMAKMGDKDKAAFMAMSPEERKKKMMMSKRDDETIEVAGQTISKSVVGDQMFAIMKAQDAQLKANQEAIAKAQEAAEMATLTKRASEEFSHVPGTAEEVAALLKFAKGMPEGVQTTLGNLMKSYEQTIAKAFESQGHAHVASPVMKSATEQVETLAKAYAEKNSVDYSTAYSKVIEQNPALYDQMIGEGN